MLFNQRFFILNSSPYAVGVQKWRRRQQHVMNRFTSVRGCRLVFSSTMSENARKAITVQGKEQIAVDSSEIFEIENCFQRKISLYNDGHKNDRHILWPSFFVAVVVVAVIDMIFGLHCLLSDPVFNCLARVSVFFCGHINNIPSPLYQLELPHKSNL